MRSPIAQEAGPAPAPTPGKGEKGGKGAGKKGGSGGNSKAPPRGAADSSGYVTSKEVEAVLVTWYPGEWKGMWW